MICVQLCYLCMALSPLGWSNNVASLNLVLGSGCIYCNRLYFSYRSICDFSGLRSIYLYKS